MPAGLHLEPPPVTVWQAVLLWRNASEAPRDPGRKAAMSIAGRVQQWAGDKDWWRTCIGNALQAVHLNLRFLAHILADNANYSLVEGVMYAEVFHGLLIYWRHVDASALFWEVIRAWKPDVYLMDAGHYTLFRTNVPQAAFLLLLCSSRPKSAAGRWQEVLRWNPALVAASCVAVADTLASTPRHADFRVGKGFTEASRFCKMVHGALLTNVVKVTNLLLNRMALNNRSDSAWVASVCMRAGFWRAFYHQIPGCWSTFWRRVASSSASAPPPTPEVFLERLFKGKPEYYLYAEEISAQGLQQLAYWREWSPLRATFVGAVIRLALPVSLR
jgi:hypothetical protein